MFETNCGRGTEGAVRAVWRGVFAALAVGLILFFPQSAAAQGKVPFAADYRGVFQIMFGAGPGGTDDLRFSGSGKARGLGRSDVDGHSTTRPSATDPLCSDIVTDRVILTAANGDKLWLVNAGEDCLDFSVPGRVFIRGSGTMAVVGGTGRFQGSTGSGTFAVVAEVMASVPGGVAGTFDLRFVGNLVK